MGFPRLLSKREIDHKKAQERQMILDEGGKLARTVDTLRELRASEESALEQWRVETIAAIQREINDKILERDAIHFLSKRDGSHDPSVEGIDKRWLAYIGEQKKLLDTDVRAAQELRRTLSIEIANKEQAIVRRDYALRVEKENVERIRAAATTDRLDAEKVVREARGQASTLITEAENAHKEMERQQKDIAIRERVIELERVQLEKKHAELEEREMKVLVKELQFYSPVKKN